jgi:hypothetical protein
VIILFPALDDDIARASRRGASELAAPRASAVESRAAEQAHYALPGIVSPLEFHADFAVNSQASAVSVTLGNGVVWLSRAGSVLSSGVLTLSLRWSPGYRADGLHVGDVLRNDWFVERVEATRIDLSHHVLREGAREIAVPVITIVKPAAAAEGDEFTARVAGGARECRESSIRGWMHG